jgi:uncharacterized protein (DUF433 family)
MLYGQISVDPEIMSGTPVFAGTRVPIQNLFDYLEGGDGLSEFLDDFPSVTREAAVAVLEMAKCRLRPKKRCMKILVDESCLPKLRSDFGPASSRTPYNYSAQVIYRLS